MTYLIIGLTFCMAVFSIVQAVNAKRQGKNGLRIVWWLLTIAFVVCFVISTASALA